MACVMTIVVVQTQADFTEASNLKEIKAKYFAGMSTRSTSTPAE